MAILTLNDLIASAKIIAPLYKTATRTTVAGGWFCLDEIAGVPGAGTLAGVGNNGAIQTDTTGGYPDIPFSTNRMHISRMTVANTVVSQMRLVDVLWKGGAYAFNANQAVTSQSWASRVSYNGGAANYNGLELWAQTVTTATGNQTWNVSYTDQGGQAGSTGAVGIGAAPTVGRCWQLPLAAGDGGLSAVTNVAGGTGSAGTANILVLRPIIDIYIGTANQSLVFNYTDLGLPEIFQDSALAWMVMAPSGTSSGTIFSSLQIANG